MTRTITGFADLGMTAAARQLLGRAAAYASSAPAIEPEHLLAAALELRSGPLAQTLRASGVDPEQLRASLGGAAPSLTPRGAAAPPLSDAAYQAVHAAAREARHLGHYQVDALHIVLGLLYDGESRAAVALAAAGAELADLRQIVMRGPKRWRSQGMGLSLDRVRSAIRVSPVFLVPLGLWLGSGVGLWLSPAENYIRPLTMLFVIAGWIVSLCLHEFGHALAAYLGGDESVRESGYLTLNPLRYANPFFSLVLPVIFLLSGGLGLPGGAVYVNTAALRSSRWERIVAAAGPLGTILFGLLVIAPFWFPWLDWWVTEANFAFWPALALLGFLQVSALVFNLLPIPPLDGFGIIAPSLPPGLRDRLRALSGVSLLLLFVLLWQDSPISEAFWAAIFEAANLVGLPLWMVGGGLMQFGA